MDLRELGQEVVDWMHPAQGKDQWRAVVNTATNFQVHKRWEFLDQPSDY
jgi:hypothetical protein